MRAPGSRHPRTGGVGPPLTKNGEAATRLAAVRAQLDERIERLVGALAEVYQAVLAHDDANLDAVLARGEEALRQLRAREEVEKLLQR